jgi:type IV secretory pathway TrbF-like protein
MTPVTPMPTNGHGPPAAWHDVPLDTLQRMELAYQEIQRRDSQAEHRASRKDRLARTLALVILGLAALVVWLALTRQHVKAFVQVVQVEDGKLVQLGLPLDLYAYTPTDAAYMEMVAQWVRWTRWRGEDQRVQNVQWAWAYRHTCGTALTWLAAYEAKEKARLVGSKRVAVTVKSVTKIAAPGGYQVLWEESTTDKAQPVVKAQLWSGTVSVGRKVLTSMEDLLDNRLGICLNAYEFSPQS